MEVLDVLMSLQRQGVETFTFVEKDRKTFRFGKVFSRKDEAFCGVLYVERFAKERSFEWCTSGHDGITDAGVTGFKVKFGLCQKVTWSRGGF